MDIKFYEVFKEEEEEIKQFLDQSIHAVFTYKTIQEEGDKEPPAKLISIRTQSRIPLEWADSLSGVLSRSQGYDHLIDYQKATQTKIPLGYLATYCSRAVAEHAIMALMVLMRKTKRQMKNFLSFQRDNLTGNLLLGKKTLVIGVGNIGHEIYKMAKGLMMNVKGVDIDRRHKDVRYVSLNEGIQWADVIFCAVPLTDKTEGMLNYALFNRVTTGVFFVNISRGEVSPLNDLEKLLEEEKIQGLALDVFEEEKKIAHFLRAEDEGAFQEEIFPQLEVLLNMEKKDNVLFTPHNAFNSKESLLEKARLSAESVKEFFQTNQFLFNVKQDR